MSGSRDEYQKHIDNGHNAAWRGKWTEAAEHYTRALAIMPEDPVAHTNLGLALLNSEQFDKSLKVYRRAIQLAPDDPEPLERSADVLERMGQLKEAAQQYVKVSEVYLAQKDLTKAIGSWERATQLTPGLVSVHAKLAQAYERIGDKGKAIREYLTLAFNFRRLDDVEKAIRAVERALRLDPKNAQSLNTLRALQSGGEVILPDDVVTRKRVDAPVETEFEGNLFWSPDDDAIVTVGEADPRGPIGESLNDALEALAAYLVQIGLDQSVAFALQGMEYQRQDAIEEAIEAYQEADESNLKHPSLQMNLGGLLVLSEKPQESLPYLQGALEDSQFIAGALHGLGLAYYQLDDHVKAARNLIQSLQAVDTSLAMPDEIDELKSVYNNILTALDGRSKETLKAVNDRFIDLLSGKDWKQRIAETRRYLDETISREGTNIAIEMLTSKGGDELAESVARIDRYIRQGIYTLAMDEAHRAVESAPFYLPIHVRMAEIMMKEGRIRQAINKYNIIAKAYMVRNENDRAASILEEVLEKAPLDVEVRMSLINLLESEERWGEAVNQYVDLAKTYEQLSDFERSSQTLGSAERLARRINAPATKLVEIKHAIAEIHQMRINARQAQKVYEEIVELIPDDEKALKNLVEIYYSQGNQIEGIKRMDALLGVYAKKGMVNRMTSLLNDLVRMYPQDTALRSRLASIFRKLGDNKRAIEQLDVLGELQLEAGLHKEAANTIRQIISMNPERVDDYKKLLSQLKVDE